MTTDRDLQEQVLQALRNEPQVEAAEIGVTVDDGIVTLSGTVPTFARREAAEAAVLRLHDVSDLANELQVSIADNGRPTDEDIAAAVRGALESKLEHGDGAIKTSVSHGVVALHGSVDSWQAVANAESAVGDVPGVQDVIDDLVVRQARLIPEVAASEVEQALVQHLGHPVHGIRVTVEGGTAVLSGPVRSLAERHQAVAIARMVTGVREVRDHLYIRG